MAVIWLRRGPMADWISMECRARIGHVFSMCSVYIMSGESPPIFVPLSTCIWHMPHSFPDSPSPNIFGIFYLVDLPRSP